MRKTDPRFWFDFHPSIKLLPSSRPSEWLSFRRRKHLCRLFDLSSFRYSALDTFTSPPTQQARDLQVHTHFTLHPHFHPSALAASPRRDDEDPQPNLADGDGSRRIPSCASSRQKEQQSPPQSFTRPSFRRCRYAPFVPPTRRLRLRIGGSHDDPGGHHGREIYSFRPTHS